MTTFGWRISMLAAVLSLAALLPQGASTQPEVNALKKGVVRIRNTRNEEVGTGFIVKVNPDGVYIVTAAHVVRGDESPEVYLFTRQHESLRAKLLNREEDDRKGLALLWLKVDGQTLAGLRALSLGSSSGLNGGEEVTLLGFPDGTNIWTVTRGTVARREGREVVFWGAVSTGNSGGPLLRGESVVGLVTDKGPTFSYAAQAESVAQYIRGIEPELADLSARPTPTVTPRATPTPTPSPASRIKPTFPPISPRGANSPEEFCKAVDEVLVASEKDFRPIMVDGDIAGPRFYTSKVKIPGFTGQIQDHKATFSEAVIDIRPLSVKHAEVVSKIRRCLPAWENKERPKSRDAETAEHVFRDSPKGKHIVVSYSERDDVVLYFYRSGFDLW